MQHDDGAMHGRLVETMRAMTETASDAYLLAYALVDGLDRDLMRLQANTGVLLIPASQAP